MPPRKRARAADDTTSAADESTHTLVVSHDHLSADFKAFAAMWRAGQLCDVKVAVEGGTSFDAHKVVLAAGSDFFKALFTSGMRENSSSTVTVCDVTSDVMQAVLTFLYDKQLSVTPSTLAAIMQAASQLEIASLLSVSSAFLVETLSVETCIASWDVALSIARPELDPLRSACERKAIAAFEELAARPEFACLSAAQLKPLLESDNIRVKEEAIFNSLVNWLSECRPPLPQASAVRLLSLIRYPLMKPDFIHATVEPFLSSYGPSGQALTFEAYRHHSLPLSARPKSPRTKLRFPTCPYGVQLSLPSEFLDRWTCQFDFPYSHATTRAELEAVPARATHIFVGARSPEGELVLGACGERNAVLQRTHGHSTHENNGVFWYNAMDGVDAEGRELGAFGFSRTDDVDLKSADTSQDDGEYRLSWHLNDDGDEHGDGGWRAGLVDDLCEDSDWRMVVYWMTVE